MSEEQLDSKIRTHRFGQNQESSYHLTTKTKWIAELLDELEESLEDDEKPEGSDLQLEMTLANKDSSSLGEHFVIKGRFYGGFHTACVRCLIPTPQKINTEFACCFLPEQLEKSPEYEEATEVYCDEQNMDLYFSEARGIIDLKELIHEQLFMSIDPLPLHAEDCKGLCPTCGINLNIDTCEHSNP